MATDANSKISNSYRVGLNHVGSYQAAGVPWLTSSLIGANGGNGSVQTFEFPWVAKSVVVSVVSPLSIQTGKPEISQNISVFFGEPKTEAGTVSLGYDCFAAADTTTWPAQLKQGHSRVLQFPSQSLDIGARCTSVNIGLINGTAGGLTGAVTIYAELTNIPASRMAPDYVSGSGINTYS